ncbi:hypothetical protein ACFYP4_29015 [Streptomyces sp. NPDC005551]
MPTPRVTSRVALLAVVALLAGCGTQGPHPAGPTPSASRAGEAPVHGA